MHKNTVFSDLNFNLKTDTAEVTIFLQATTRGDISVQKNIFLGVKKACKFNVANTDYEFVFDHGYAGDTYGVSDLIKVFNTSTSNTVESPADTNWGASCTIDIIIYER